MVLWLSCGWEAFKASDLNFGSANWAGSLRKLNALHALGLQFALGKPWPHLQSWGGLAASGTAQSQHIMKPLWGNLPETDGHREMGRLGKGGG